MDEIWKDVVGYEGRYMISSKGRVKNNKGQLKAIKISNSGYYMVNLYIGHKGKTKYIHRLIAEAFIPNPDNKREVNHIDECKTNNTIENLEWVSHSENRKHGTNIERQRESLNRHYNDPKNERKQYVRCVELDQVFFGLQHASNLTGINNGTISACLRGKGKTAGGYHWELIDRKDIKKYETII